MDWIVYHTDKGYTYVQDCFGNKKFLGPYSHLYGKTTIAGEIIRTQKLDGKIISYLIVK